jgi:hypothetical protein
MFIFLIIYYMGDDMKDELIPVPTYNDIMNFNYEPETEQDLINLVKTLNDRITCWTIGTYWIIGNKINSFYERKGNYGKGTLEKISLDVGIGIDTLRKSLKFSRTYNEEQLKTLLNGTFLLKWFHIAQNLTVEPENFIEIYNKTESSGEFNKDINQHKINDLGKIIKSEIPETVFNKMISDPSPDPRPGNKKTKRRKIITKATLNRIIASLKKIVKRKIERLNF